MPMDAMKLAEKLRKKYKELQEEPLLDELVDLSYGEGEEDMEPEVDIELEVEPMEGDDEMLEDYDQMDEAMLDEEMPMEEEEDVDSYANSPLMAGEEEDKKKDYKRRMALRKALKF